MAADSAAPDRPANGPASSGVDVAGPAALEPGAAPAAAGSPPRPVSALRELVQRLDAPDPGEGAAQPGGEAADWPRELKVVRRHRQTWARLRLQQQLRRSGTHVPANAGPLNAQRVVQRLLASLEATSPAYLQQVMLQVEALMWLEDAAQAGPALAAGRGAGGRAGNAGAAAGRQRKPLQRSPRG